jgi:hypothetical protein
MGNCFQSQSIADILNDSIIGKLVAKEELTQKFYDAFIKIEVAKGANLPLYEDSFLIVASGEVIISIEIEKKDASGASAKKNSIQLPNFSTIDANPSESSRNAMKGDIIIIPQLLVRSRALSLKTDQHKSTVVYFVVVSSKNPIFQLIHILLKNNVKNTYVIESKIYGCGKPFYLQENNATIPCEYI